MLPMLINFAVLFVFVIALFYAWIHQIYGYWKRKNVYSPPAKFPLGHLVSKGERIYLGVNFCNLYNENKSHPFIGLYVLTKKILLVNDLELVKNVLSKDYVYFQGHGFKSNKEVDPLGQHLFNLEGDEWKSMRVKLTPTFTSSKIKSMFKTMLSCTNEMISYIGQQLEKETILDFKEILAKLGTDVIGSCAFGIQTNCFKHPDAEFRKMGKAFFKTSTFTAIFDTMSFLFPKLVENIRLSRIPAKVTKFFQNVVKETIEYRETNNVRKNDFLQLLIDMKNSADSGSRLSMPEIAAQVFVFFLAGFETSSTTATYTLLELAKNPQIRDKLVNNIDQVLEETGGEITYESLANMTYLTQVIEETLRMYPPVSFLFRTCTRNYKIPGTDIVIENGTPILIPTLGIHRDSDIYPNPSQYDPERFAPVNVKKRHQYAHIPFGEGPRVCIGSRFGMIQVKVALVTILRTYHIELSDKTDVNPKFDPKSFILQSESGMPLKATCRRKEEVLVLQKNGYKSQLVE